MAAASAESTNRALPSSKRWQSTFYAYDWHEGTFQPSRITTMLPEVSAAESLADHPAA